MSERILCMECGKSVSTPVPLETIVRAYVECPECMELRFAKEEREREADRAALLAAACHMPGESFSLWLADHHVAYLRAHDADQERRAAIQRAQDAKG